MNQAFKCKLGMHQYEVHDTKENKNSFNFIIGETIISRCKHCGKIKVTRVYYNDYR